MEMRDTAETLITLRMSASGKSRRVLIPAAKRACGAAAAQENI